MTKILLHVIASGILLAISVVQVHAEDILEVYLFQESTGNFRLDRFVDEPVVVTENGRVNTSTEGDFYVTYIDSRQEEINEEEYYFSPLSDDFVLQLPYVPSATGLRIFRTSRGALMSQIDIQTVSTCNQDSVCALEGGENIQTCPQDCQKENPTFSEQTRQTLTDSSGEVVDEDGNIILSEAPLSLESTTDSIETSSTRNRYTIPVFVGGGTLFAILGSILIYKIYKK